MQKIISFALILALSNCGPKEAVNPVAPRIESLIQAMTLEEKVGQLNVYVGEPRSSALVPISPNLSAGSSQTT